MPRRKRSGREGATGVGSTGALGDPFEQNVREAVRLQQQETEHKGLEVLPRQGQETDSKVPYIRESRYLQNQDAEHMIQEALRIQGQEVERRMQEALRIQEQEMERKVTEALRLQEQRAETALGEAVHQMKQKLQEKDNVISGLQRRLQESQESVIVSKGRKMSSERAEGEAALQCLDGQMDNEDSPLTAIEKQSGRQRETLVEGTALSGPFQQMAQELANIRLQQQEGDHRVQETLLKQDQETERRMQETWRLQKQEMEQIKEVLREQKQRTATTLREIVRQLKQKLQEKDDAIHALEQRLEETQERLRVVEERTMASEASGTETTLQSLKDRMEKVESSLQKAMKKFLPRVDVLLRQLEKPITEVKTRSSNSSSILPSSSTPILPSSSNSTLPSSSTSTLPSSSTSSSPSDPSPPYSSTSTYATILCDALANGSAATRDGENTPSPVSPRAPSTKLTITCAGHQGAAANDEERQRRRVELRVQETKSRMKSRKKRTRFSMEEYLLWVVGDGNISEVRFIVGCGVDVNYISIHGCTPLFRAVCLRNAYIVSYLVQNGADANTVDISGNSALHVAAMEDQNGECVNLLIDAGGDVNARNLEGSTPLHFAAENRNEMAVRALLAAGARKDIKPWDGHWEGKTPFEVASTSEVFIWHITGNTSKRTGKRNTPHDIESSRNIRDLLRP